jgi:hypothetical protein
VTHRLTPRDNREERGSRDQHIRRLISTLISPILTVSYESRLRVNAHDHPGAHSLLAECARQTNAPLELITRVSLEDPFAEERRRRWAHY